LSACQAHANQCSSLEPRFEQYRQALKSQSDLATFFSRSYLEDQIDGLLVDGDDALLHNAKAALLRVRLTDIARSDYTSSIQCVDDAAAVNLSFPRGDLGGVTLSYVYELGAWRISRLQLNIRHVTIPDGT
jgi:hypothetical protein